MRIGRRIGGALMVALGILLMVPAGTAEAASCGPVGPFECSARGSTPVPGGVIDAGFTDRWTDVGMRTWTLRTSSSGGVSGPVPGNAQILLTETFCANKYGFSLQFSGPGVGPATEASCAQRSGTGVGRATNDGEVVVRGNPYGRWIWFSHSVDIRITVGNQNYFVNSYRRVGPNGGDV